MFANHLLALKIQTLRAAVDKLREYPLLGMDPQSRNALADQLSRRADRIEAGEEDRSLVFPDLGYYVDGESLD
jgi:hypothetical protein